MEAVSSNLDMLNVEVEEMNDGVSDSDDDNLEEDVNNIMYEVFGSDDDIRWILVPLTFLVTLNIILLTVTLMKSSCDISCLFCGILLV